MLVYPNITKSGRDITKDSYIVLLPDVIETLLKINKKLHITLLLPSNVKRDERIRKLDKSSSVELKSILMKINLLLKATICRGSDR